MNLGIFKNELLQLHNAFDENELAYLALTSKADAPIRDKMAFSLQRKLAVEKENLLCARDWRDIDIAIMKNFTEPACLVVCKSGYTADDTDANPSMQGFYTRKLLDDLHKTTELATNTTELFGVLLYTHLNKAIDSPLKKIVKYDNAINRAFTHFNHNDQQIATQASQSVTSFLHQNKIPYETGIIAAGACWDIRVEIWFWVIGGFTKKTLPNIT